MWQTVEVNPGTRAPFGYSNQEHDLSTNDKSTFSPLLLPSKFLLDDEVEHSGVLVACGVLTF
jgi:hypothetical protein